LDIWGICGIKAGREGVFSTRAALTKWIAKGSQVAMKPIPSPALLRKLLQYDECTGKLYWRESTPSDFTADSRTQAHKSSLWNSQYSGKEAFTCTDASGRRRGRILGSYMLAHRAIWAMHVGHWNFDLVDHINMDPSDNRLSNLRQATKSQNGANRKKKVGSSSEYLGVGWHKRAGKWKASISLGGLTSHLGLFASEEDAAIAYDNAARKAHGEFAAFNFPN